MIYQYGLAIVLDSDWTLAGNANWKFDAKQIIRPQRHRFSGGEVHVQFPVAWEQQDSFLLAHRLNSADNLMELLLAYDAIRGMHPTTPIDLLCPYIPYARQDRRMVSGDPLSIKIFANLINTCQFREVFVLDPHSDVAPAVIDRCHILPIDAFVARALEVSNADYIVVPDAGAAKKLYSLVQRLHARFPHLKTLQAGKIRDLAQRGQITAMHLEGNPDLTGKSCLIVDDICDGGRTFLELSKLLRNHAAAQVALFVSHGIFSKGLGCLLDVSVAEGRLDIIFTTNSIRTLDSQTAVTQFEL